MNVNLLINEFGQFFWPLLRMGGLLISMPVVSSAMVSTKVRLAFLMVLGLMAYQLPIVTPHLQGFSFLHLLIIAQELMIGVLLGFVLQIVFQAFIVGGQLIAMQIGLGFAIMMDPTTKSNVPLVSQFYLLFVTLIFLSINGHLMAIQYLFDSYQQLPMVGFHLSEKLYLPVLGFSQWIFKGAVMVALPAILSLLLVNLSFGIMVRAAPQLNIFSIGFPITLTFGIAIVYWSLPSILPSTFKLFEHAYRAMLGVIS